MSMSMCILDVYFICSICYYVLIKLSTCNSFTVTARTHLCTVYAELEIIDLVRTYTIVCSQ